jgi:hypothetical protein
MYVLFNKKIKSSLIEGEPSLEGIHGLPFKN